ncbi:MAG: hypothetical protein CGU28_04890 [Candidatus Dactylopiibacterium carminicum]|uniref:Peptidoglycan endopeptidase n=1 Tax=Candidatus Dactylopiibacterium carminicum TaxID=857335 RepID=A0A272EU89_9RHOO|nr:C40 family peptidase [Candidatus Dactylopiibacterium carminicum]KAF7599733.1 peptidoglycan endopeptidase [Candidatus Dactylopiibacterium carminicum]PAS93669.1 MAG: hypothetical protein CGU29_06960 [Candidatus Dactylopiibacterium carminicum]PAS97537.1 MAG: hypothetical protein CGU28_04890 [Candidatus Dactylopiibacterium carminicum]PAS99735.1 MAG: hypothetical protein BSR46_06555 [Candidatus Dactylopiibacterium carminicum]
MRRLFAACSLALLAACGGQPAKRPTPTPTPAERPAPHLRLEDQYAANEIVLRAMGLLDTGYLFGGRNPEAGLDCSGMVSLVVEQATGLLLPHNAAQIASRTRKIARSELRAADLVFFNTNGKPYSHMGIYLGDGRFIHAPSSRGKVRVESIDKAYWTQRFTAAHSLF